MPFLHIQSIPDYTLICDSTSGNIELKFQIPINNTNILVTM